MRIETILLENEYEFPNVTLYYTSHRIRSVTRRAINVTRCAMLPDATC